MSVFIFQCQQLYYLTSDDSVTLSDAMKTNMKAGENSNKCRIFLGTRKPLGRVARLSDLPAAVGWLLTDGAKLQTRQH